MPIELVAAWLLREAYKLVVIPVGKDLQQRFNRKLSERIETTVSDKLFGESPAGDQATDLEFVKTIESAPDAAESLAEDIQETLQVTLPAESARRGTAEWYVSAYE